MQKIKADLHAHGYERKSCPTSAEHILKIAKRNLDVNGVFGIANSQWEKTSEGKADYDSRYELFFRKCLEEFGARQIEVNGASRNKSNIFYVNPYKIHVLKTQEMEFPQGHILVLGLPYGTNLKQKNIIDSLKQAKDMGYPVQGNHPFFMSNLGNYLSENQEVLDYISGLEVHNGEAIFGNNKAKKFYNESCKDKNIGALSSSDAHSPFEIGGSYTVLSEIDFTQNIEKVNESLDKKIREHKNWLNDKQKLSLRGFITHAGKFSARLALLNMGINLS